MKEYLLKNKQALSLLLMALVLGTWLRGTGLYNAKLFFCDEYNAAPAYDWESPFQNIAYKIPVLLFGNYHDVVLSTSAFLGIINILLVFLVGKTLFNEKAGGYAALVLSMMATHIRYSRTGYPVILQSVIMLTAFWCFALYYTNRKQRLSLVFFSGILLGLSFLTYAPSYAAIAVFIAMFSLVQYERERSLKKTFKVLALLTGSSLMVLVLLETYYRTFIGSYLSNLLRYNERTSHFVPQRMSALKIFFNGTIADGGAAQLGLMAAGFLFGVGYYVKKKDPRLLWLVGFTGLSYLLFTLMGFRFHSVRIRHYIFMISLFSVCAGFFLYHAERLNKYVPVVIMIVFMALSLGKLYTVINQLFRTDDISGWLTQHKIGKDRILSALNLYERGDQIHTKELPGSRQYYDYKFHYKIDWEKIKALYGSGQAGYIMLPGVGYNKYIKPNDDPVLKKTEPLKTWSHSYRPPTAAITLKRKFALYDLDRIMNKADVRVNINDH